MCSTDRASCCAALCLGCCWNSQPGGPLHLPLGTCRSRLLPFVDVLVAGIEAACSKQSLSEALCAGWNRLPSLLSAFPIASFLQGNQATCWLSACTAPRLCVCAVTVQARESRVLYVRLLCSVDVGMCQCMVAAAFPAGAVGCFHRAAAAIPASVPVCKVRHDTARIGVWVHTCSLFGCISPSQHLVHAQLSCCCREQAAKITVTLSAGGWTCLLTGPPALLNDNTLQHTPSLTFFPSHSNSLLSDSHSLSHTRAHSPPTALWHAA